MTPVFACPPSSSTGLTALFSPDERLPAETAITPARILIVEDDYLAATEIETVLREAGFEVVGVAGSADESLRLVRSESPALVIMDVRLARRGDGVDAALTIFRETGIRCCPS
jgi:two-component system, response regulator PdtaR